MKIYSYNIDSKTQIITYSDSDKSIRYYTNNKLQIHLLELATEPLKEIISKLLISPTDKIIKVVHSGNILYRIYSSKRLTKNTINTIVNVYSIK